MTIQEPKTLKEKILAYARLVKNDAMKYKDIENYNTYLVMSKIANQLTVMAEGDDGQ